MFRESWGLCVQHCPLFSPQIFTSAEGDPRCVTVDSKQGVTGPRVEEREGVGGPLPTPGLCVSGWQQGYTPSILYLHFNVLYPGLDLL